MRRRSSLRGLRRFSGAARVVASSGSAQGGTPPGSASAQAETPSAPIRRPALAPIRLRPSRPHLTRHSGVSTPSSPFGLHSGHPDRSDGRRARPGAPAPGDLRPARPNRPSAGPVAPATSHLKEGTPVTPFHRQAASPADGPASGPPRPTHSPEPPVAGPGPRPRLVHTPRVNLVKGQQPTGAAVHGWTGWPAVQLGARAADQAAQAGLRPRPGRVRLRLGLGRGGQPRLLDR